MKRLILFVLLIFLVGCIDTTVRNEQVQQEPTASAVQEPVAPVIQKESTQKELSLYEVQQMVCAFVKTCAFTEKLTAGKLIEIPENQPLKYYETIGGPFMIMEGQTGNFSLFVQNQAKLRFEKLKKSIHPTDFQIQPSYSVEEYNGAYIYKYKIWKYTVTSKAADEKLFMDPVYGARFFIKCSNYVVEVFPDVFGGKVQEWSGLEEPEYDATIENGIQFQINNMKPKADSLISRCKQFN